MPNNVFGLDADVYSVCEYLHSVSFLVAFTMRFTYQILRMINRNDSFFYDINFIT